MWTGSLKYAARVEGCSNRWEVSGEKSLLIEPNGGAGNELSYRFGRAAETKLPTVDLTLPREGGFLTLPCEVFDLLPLALI
jgi:hypothetical protein